MIPSYDRSTLEDRAEERGVRGRVDRLDRGAGQRAARREHDVGAERPRDELLEPGRPELPAEIAGVGPGHEEDAAALAEELHEARRLVRGRRRREPSHGPV